MFIRTSIRLRRAITLMVLLAVFIALLPQHGAAQSIPNPRIYLTNDEVREQIYSLWEKRLPNYGTKVAFTERHIRALLVSNELLSDASPYDADVILKQADALQERYIERLGPRGADPAYRDSLPPRVVIETMLTAGLENPVFAFAAKRAYEGIRRVALTSLGDPSAPSLPAYQLSPTPTSPTTSPP